MVQIISPWKSVLIHHFSPRGHIIVRRHEMQNDSSSSSAVPIACYILLRCDLWRLQASRSYTKQSRWPNSSMCYPAGQSLLVGVQMRAVQDEHRGISAICLNSHSYINYLYYNYSHIIVVMEMWTRTEVSFVNLARLQHSGTNHFSRVCPKAVQVESDWSPCFPIQKKAPYSGCNNLSRWCICMYLPQYHSISHHDGCSII